MSRWRRGWSDLLARVRAGDGEEGNGILEFLGLSVVLLVPIVYLTLVLGRVQAATFAAEGAAREAARTYVTSDSEAVGAQRAVASVGLALRDQSFDDDAAEALTLTCSATPCLVPGGRVRARVEILVPLPFVPEFVRGAIPLEVPVSADRVAAVDVFRSRS
ncbi:pilus assembly protein [Cellulomonas sp. URHB0016]